MPQEIIHQQGGVARIVFRPAIGKRFAISRQAGGRQWEQEEEVVLQQGVGDRPVRLLEAHRDGPAAEPLPQSGRPLVDGLWRVWQFEVLRAPTPRIIEHEVMFSVGPIQADEGGKQ